MQVRWCFSYIQNPDQGKSFISKLLLLVVLQNVCKIKNVIGKMGRVLNAFVYIFGNFQSDIE